MPNTDFITKDGKDLRVVYSKYDPAHVAKATAFAVEALAESQDLGVVCQQVSDRLKAEHIICGQAAMIDVFDLVWDLADLAPEPVEA